MLEPWRSHYLRAIGVEMYLPRYDLPAAGASIEIPWDPLADAPVAVVPPAVAVATQSAVTQSSPTKTSAAKAPISQAPKVSEVEKAVRAPIETEPPARANAIKSAATQIHLYVACDGDGILVVDEIPTPQRREYMQRLIVNLLFAAERKSVKLSAEQFDWPLPSLRNRQVTLDDQAGRETIDGFLSRKIHAENIHTIYLLGESAVHWVSSDQRQALSLDHPIKWKISVGAQSVLGDARLKRRWWKDLCDPAKQ